MNNFCFGGQGTLHIALFQLIDAKQLVGVVSRGQSLLLLRTQTLLSRILKL